MVRLVVFLVSAALDVLRAVCRPREELVLENLALRQQVGALLRQRPRPELDDIDRAFWIALRRSWPKWADTLLVVKADTVARWHRERFRRHWANLSRRPGRPRIDTEIRDLIREMASHGWGAPRIHGELLKLGFDVSEATASRYMPKRPPAPDQLAGWIAFLRNHKDAIAAMDFFTVPTLSLRVLYGLFIIEHGRRRILHFNATYHPTAEWVIQQLRETFPFDSGPPHLIFDRDAIFSAAVVRFVEALGAKPRRTAYRSPWQNPVAERWIGSCRRELLDHVVVFDPAHLVRLVRTYTSYYHEDRCHLGLVKDSPSGREVTPRPSPSAKVVSLPRVGGLQRRYVWREAA